MMIYADNAATTKMSRTAIAAMLPYMEESYGNPSSLYAFGQQAREALEEARSRIAACLGCEPRELTFTSGGSEADNQAILSAAHLGGRQGKQRNRHHPTRGRNRRGLPGGRGALSHRCGAGGGASSH